MEHFIVMLDILNDMTIGKNQNLQLMEYNGKVLENMSDGYDCFFGVADLHSITVRPNPADLRRRTTGDVRSFIGTRS